MNSRFLHRWLGLSVGLVLSLVCLSGALLLHKSSLLPLIYPQLGSALQQRLPDQEVGQAKVDLTRVEQLLARDHKKPLAVVLPKDDWPVYTLVYNKTTRAFFDLNGRYLTTLDSGSDPFAWLFDLHQNLLLGSAGKKINGWVQLFTLALLLTGLLLWWPKRRLRKALTVDFSVKGRKFWFQLHRTCAVAAIPLLLLMVASGVGLLFYSQTKQVLTGLFGDTENQQVISAQPVDGLSDVLTQGRELWPQIQWTLIYVPTEQRPNWRLRGKFAEEWHGNGRSFMTFESENGGQIQLQDARGAGTGLALAQKLYPLHNATVGGAPYLWLLTLVGIIPMFLWASGVYLYGYKSLPF